MVSAFILLMFLSVAQHELSIRKHISWLVTVYSKILSGQCNLTAEIEPVQDNMHISHSENNNTIAHIEIRQTIQVLKDKKIKVTNNDL
jgi:predicted transcriptional regulator